MELTIRTFPMTTESTIFGSMLPAASAAFAATICSSVDEVFTNLPPYVPKGVLLAATIKTPDRMNKSLKFNLKLLNFNYKKFIIL